MIPSVSREKLIEAIEEFDKELRGTQEWSNWEKKGIYKFAILHDGQRYPVKQIISMATGEPKTNFSGGYEANSYVSKRGLSTIPLENEKTNGLSIRDGLEEILTHYASARANEPFKGHELRQTFNDVSHAIAATNTVSGRQWILPTRPAPSYTWLSSCVHTMPPSTTLWASTPRRHTRRRSSRWANGCSTSR